MKINIDERDYGFVVEIDDQETINRISKKIVSAGINCEYHASKSLIFNDTGSLIFNDTARMYDTMIYYMLIIVKSKHHDKFVLNYLLASIMAHTWNDEDC